MSKSLREAASEGPAVLHICFCSLSNISVAARTTNPDMATVFHARLSGRFIGIQSNLSRKTSLIKAPIFFEAVLAKISFKSNNPI